MCEHKTIGKNLDLLSDLTFIIRKIEEKLTAQELDEYEKCLYILLLKLTYDKITGNNTNIISEVIYSIFNKMSRILGIKKEYII